MKPSTKEEEQIYIQVYLINLTLILLGKKMYALTDIVTRMLFIILNRIKYINMRVYLQMLGYVTPEGYPNFICCKKKQKTVILQKKNIIQALLSTELL